MSTLPYAEIPPVPGTISGGAVLARMVDALGFRFYYATEGLREEDYAFRACESSKTLGELIEHVHALVAWTDGHFGGEALADLPEPATPVQWREATLRRLEKFGARVAGMNDAQFEAVQVSRKDATLPFWYLINGPLADALTHVGQLTGWRRMNGNPVPAHSVFMGKKLEG